MKFDSHLELFLLKGKISLMPSQNQNGKVSINELPLELFQELSFMPNEAYHEGDAVYFFMVPTKYLVDDITGYGNYTAINVSRIRRRVFINDFVSYRPCTNGTTIPPVTSNNVTNESYYNFTLSEFNQLIITEAPIKIIPYSIVDEDSQINLIQCPLNKHENIACRQYHSTLQMKWE